ncbi:MAG: EF-P lysine aminoacylase GenX [Parachlamydiales bacterium]|nr:EF-P lysine aminoacylase GenX [Parachlamydiales bacterium]
MSLASKEILEDRAAMFSLSRDFFRKKNITEVDCPALLSYPSIDAFIEPFSVNVSPLTKKYLHTSPEFSLKKLIARGMNNIYQLGHVFRKEEEGDRHRSEFTLAEWYHKLPSFDLFIQETIEYISLFVPITNIHYFSYRSLFKTFLDIDPFLISQEKLRSFLISMISINPSELERDSMLSLLLTHLIEPKLQEITVINDYPSSQAALAQTKTVKDIEVAERFEIYYNDIELANGYHELRDPVEQRRRFILTNQERLQEGKEPLPLDEEFIQAMSLLPDIYGVAVGFDRLMMIRHRKKVLAEVLPF